MVEETQVTRCNAGSTTVLKMHFQMVDGSNGAAADLNTKNLYKVSGLGYTKGDGTHLFELSRRAFSKRSIANAIHEVKLVCDLQIFDKSDAHRASRSSVGANSIRAEQMCKVCGSIWYIKAMVCVNTAYTIVTFERLFGLDITQL